MREVPQMSSMIDKLFDQYERGGMTRRHLVQALAALVLPASARAQTAAPAAAPLVKAYNINHVGLTVTDLKKSYAFYEKLFGITKGWPATDAKPGFPEGTGVHMGLPDGYISIDDQSAGPKGRITHFCVATDHMDKEAAKRLTDKINQAMPEANARDAYQVNTGGLTVNLKDPDNISVQIGSRDGR